MNYKKIIVICIITILLLTFAACSDSGNKKATIYCSDLIFGEFEIIDRGEIGEWNFSKDNEVKFLNTLHSHENYLLNTQLKIKENSDISFLNGCDSSIFYKDKKFYIMVKYREGYIYVDASYTFNSNNYEEKYDSITLTSLLLLGYQQGDVELGKSFNSLYSWNEIKLLYQKESIDEVNKKITIKNGVTYKNEKYDYSIVYNSDNTVIFNVDIANYMI